MLWSPFPGMKPMIVPDPGQISEPFLEVPCRLISRARIQRMVSGKSVDQET